MLMTVQELIDRLQKVEDKTKGVWVLNGSDELSTDIQIDEYDESIEIYSKE